MISKKTALDALRIFREENLSNMIWDSALRIQRGGYEYIFRADEVNYVGSGAECVIASFGDESWSSHGNAQLEGATLTLDGASWLERGAIELGGRDFQILGKAYEDGENVAYRQKIFELYTSSALNLSLYSSGAGKNLDLLTNCGGTFDDYSEPAILAQEYFFAVKWRQSTQTLSLEINGTEIYSREVAGLVERKRFERVLIGGSVLHENATWRGTISDLKIYDGFAEA